MALHGDFKTFPLPDLLQWLEASHRSGRLTVVSGGGDRFFLLGTEGIVRYGAPGLYEKLARVLKLVGALDELGGQRAVGEARAGLPAEKAFPSAGVPAALLREMARDDAMQSATDLFEDSTATFHFGEEFGEDEDETVLVELSLRELLYEAARRHDEAMLASERIGGDAIVVRPSGKIDPPPKGLAAAALCAVKGGGTMGSVRLQLGLSRWGAARLLFELWRSGHVHIDGAEAPQPDPLTHMLSQGAKLLADRQFDAAALVFNSLLAADPSDPRVRDFARAVDREHVEALYQKLSPLSVPKLVVEQSSLSALRPDERIIAALVNGRWDVSTLVLASPLRELQTLRAIERMSELGFVDL